MQATDYEKVIEALFALSRAAENAGNERRRQSRDPKAKPEDKQKADSEFSAALSRFYVLTTEAGEEATRVAWAY